MITCIFKNNLHMQRINKKLILLFSLFIISSSVVRAQIEDYYSEAPGFSLGTTIGLSDLWGDIGTASSMDHYMNSNYKKNVTFMGGLLFRYTFVPAFSLRFGVNYGKLYASDNFNEDLAKKAKSMEEDAAQRYYRNLNVRTNIWEGNIMFEFAPFRMNTESNRSRRRMQPYITGGIGIFHYKPQGLYINRATRREQWVDLIDLHTEGVGLSTTGATSAALPSLWQVAIPMGFGMRWDLNHKVSLGVEYIYRTTMTDLLDDVSDKYVNPQVFTASLSPEKAAIATDIYDKTWVLIPNYQRNVGDKRGNSADKDAYSTLSITFIYRLSSRWNQWW